MQLHELKEENERLLLEVENQLRQLRLKRDALVARKCAIESMSRSITASESAGKTGWDVRMGKTTCRTSPYNKQRHLANDRLFADASLHFTEMADDECVLPLTNFVKSIRHVLDPFSDAYLDVNDHGPTLIQGEGPLNADEVGLMKLSRYFPRPDERLEWSPMMDSMLVALVTAAGLGDERGLAGGSVKNAGQWEHISESLESHFLTKSRACVDSSPSRLSTRISVGCCCARWFQVLLPLAARNATATTGSDVLAASEYLSLSNSSWNSLSDSTITAEVAKAGCITGRLFWMEVSKKDSLLDHAAFSILCRFQRNLNPLLVCDKGAPDLFELYVNAMRESGVTLQHEDYLLRRSMNGKRFRQSSAIFEKLRNAPGDLQSHLCFYISECYREAKNCVLGAPFVVLSPQASIILLTKEQLRAKLRHGGGRAREKEVLI